MALAPRLQIESIMTEPSNAAGSSGWVDSLNVSRSVDQPQATARWTASVQIESIMTEPSNAARSSWSTAQTLARVLVNLELRQRRQLAARASAEHLRNKTGCELVEAE